MNKENIERLTLNDSNALANGYLPLQSVVTNGNGNKPSYDKIIQLRLPERPSLQH